MRSPGNATIIHPSLLIEPRGEADTQDLNSITLQMTIKYTSSLKQGILFFIMKTSMQEKKFINEPQHNKTNKITYVPIKDTDQPGHPPSLISLCSTLYEYS